MLQYFETLTDDSGNSLLGATVTVANYPSGTPAAIYNTNGTASPIGTSTVASDITGQVSFYVPDGAYTLTYSYKSTLYKTKSPVQMIDPMGFAVATDTGMANAYVVTSSAYPASLYIGLKFEFKAANSNTAGATLNLNGSGPQPINQPGGSALSPSMILATGIYRVEWDGTQWQLLGSQSPPFYPAIAAEAGITIVNFFYPPGNILRYGAIGDGATNNYTAINNAVKVANVSGLVVVVPAGNFEINTASGTINTSYVTFQGTGVQEGNATIGTQGSVISIIGTANAPFTIGAGVTFDGIGFYYPAQVDSPTPTVYPPTLLTSTALVGAINGVYVQNCIVYNAYRFFVDTDTGGSIGHVFFLDNTIYGILTCFELAYNAEIITHSGNEYTFGVFQPATEGGLRGFTRANGSVYLINRSDGLTIQQNVFFGYLNAINYAMTAQICQLTAISNNYFDNCRFPVLATGTGNIITMTISDNVANAFNGENTALIGNIIKVTTSGALALESISICGNILGTCTGDAILVSGVAPRSYNVADNQIVGIGAFQTSGTFGCVNISGASTSYIVSGNMCVNQTGTPSVANGILGSPVDAVITGNIFGGYQTAITATYNSLIATGNLSYGTLATFANNYGGNVVDVANAWDKDSQKVTGFGTPTGGTVISDFPGASPATLAQCSTTIAEILTILKAKNFIGT